MVSGPIVGARPSKRDADGQSRARSAPASTGVGRRLDGRLTLGARIALVVICLAVFLSALDQYALVTMFDPLKPGLLQDVGITDTNLDHAAWILNSYVLGYIVAMPLMGRLADVRGRRLVFTLCLVLFAVGSLFCALSPVLGGPLEPDATTLSGAVLTPLYIAVQWLLGVAHQLGVDTSLPILDVLVGARFVQAIGGGALVPVAIAVVGDLFGATRRGLALGMVGAVAEIGGVIGPLWGAWINAQWGWEWIFYLNLPLALALLVAGAFALPRRSQASGRVDILGALLLGAAVVCLSLGFGLEGQLTSLQPGSAVAPQPGLLVAAGLLLIIFVVVELLRRSPAIDVRQFARPAFAAAALLSFLTGLTLVVAIVLIPTFISVLQPSTNGLEAAVALLRMTVFIPVGALGGGWLSTRLGSPLVAAVGALLTAAGLYLMSLWPANVGAGQITVATLLAGLGYGLVIAPTNTSALNSADAGREGMAGAVVTVLRMSGMLLGLSWAFLWAVSRFTTLAAALPHFTTLDVIYDIFHQIFSELFLIAAVVALAGVVPALLLWRKPRVRVVSGTTPDDQEHGYSSYTAPLT